LESYRSAIIISVCMPNPLTSMHEINAPSGSCRPGSAPTVSKMILPHNLDRDLHSCSKPEPPHSLEVEIRLGPVVEDKHESAANAAEHICQKALVEA